MIVRDSLADWHEALDLYCPVASEEEDPTKLLYGPNNWPTNPISFRPTMEEWVEKMKIIGMALLEATAMGLGLDMKGEEWEGLKRSAEKSFWVMRCIGLVLIVLLLLLGFELTNSVN